MEEAHVALTENSEAPRDAPGDIEMVAPDGPENIDLIQKTNPTKKCDPETGMAKALYDPETEITKALCQCWVDVAEVYSPPRVTSMGEKMGLVTGYAMDLTTGWDFTLEQHREAALEYVKIMKPRLLIGSPMCTMFSALQNLSKGRRRHDWTTRFAEAREHIKFVVSLYEVQWQEGRFFLHEHPATATSWDLEEIKEMSRKTGVEIYTADQCMYGLETWGMDGSTMEPAKEMTKFVTNSLEVGWELQSRCDGQHKH